ncbi:MAG: DUF4855 domain-containing protein [Bacteroidales bacterium]|nr:DUF4855 domain-containing protein [Bacteroidales bacterium]
MITLSLLLAAACGEEQQGVYVPQPAIKLTVAEEGHTTAIILVESIFCDDVFVMAGAPDLTPSGEEIIANGVQPMEGKVVLTGLTPGTRYCAYGVGRRDGTLSGVGKANFSTGAESENIYPYEQGRNGAPRFADVTLCTGGGRPNSNSWFTVPASWDKARFAPHVSYTDPYGTHWLFEAFLSITGTDPDGKTFCINNNGSLSADKNSWQNLAQYWAGHGGAFSALDDAIADAARHAGPAPSKRYAVMMMPDPVMFERFSDKNSSTTYWGEVDGKRLDFSNADDQIKALKWYIDYVRAEFADRNFSNLELAGFYIISEELVATPGGWNYEQKRWDQILPVIGSYLDSLNEGLYWIPYMGADGTSVWRNLGITYAWLQPNYYWDAGKDIEACVRRIDELGMGLELEFEYSMVEEVMKTPGIMGPDGQGRYVFTLDDVPVLRARFREYMDTFKDAGLYGQRRIALYSGSNALYQLASSSENDDIAMYLELCRFISENPLRQ